MPAERTECVGGVQGRGWDPKGCPDPTLGTPRDTGLEGVPPACLLLRGQVSGCHAAEAVSYSLT